MSADNLFRLLETLPRQSAPAIPVETLVRRLLWRRIAIAGLCLAALTGPLLALLLLRGEPEPPVNLRLRVVDLGNPVEMPTRDPPELNLP